MPVKLLVGQVIFNLQWFTSYSPVKSCTSTTEGAEWELIRLAFLPGKKVGESLASNHSIEIKKSD